MRYSGKLLLELVLIRDVAGADLDRGADSLDLVEADVLRRPGPKLRLLLGLLTFIL